MIDIPGDLSDLMMCKYLQSHDHRWIVINSEILKKEKNVEYHGLIDFSIMRHFQYENTLINEILIINDEDQ
jgi:hypothetical protein